MVVEEKVVCVKCNGVFANMAGFRDHAQVTGHSSYKMFEG
jgi:hypothetical protein